MTVRDGRDRARRLLSLLVLALALSCLVVSCESERRSSSGGGGGGEGGGSGGEEGIPEGHVLPGESAAPASGEMDKVMRSIRRTTNYLMAATASAGASPEDPAAAAEALKTTSSMDWLRDPWGTPYVYKKTGAKSFEVFSAGPDGKEGTGDDVHVND